MSAFLRLDGVKGDSHTTNFTGWIELGSVSFGPGGTPLGTGGSRMPGGPITQMHCTTRMGSHSPVLGRLLAESKTVDGELVMTKDGTRFLQVLLKAATVASYSPGNAGGVAMESFELVALPFRMEYSAEGALLGTWNATVGKWNGLFVFEGGGRVHWTERNGTSRHDGLWRKTASDIQWKFASPGDIRTFVISLPMPAGRISGKILPVGLGDFSMTRM